MTKAEQAFQELRSIIATGYVRGEHRARAVIDGYLSQSDQKLEAAEKLRRELAPYLKNTTRAQTEFVASLLGYVERQSRKLAA